MKLLFNQNMSPKLPDRLRDVFGDSVHIQCHHLERAPDNVLWDFAKEHGFAIVTKDIDFSERSMLFGFRQKLYGSNAATAQRQIWNIFYADTRLK